MNHDYVLLIEKEEMWAQMLIQILEDNGIACAALPVYGAGFSLKTGMQEHLQIFVPAPQLPHANELVHQLFYAEIVDEET